VRACTHKIVAAGGNLISETLHIVNFR